MPNVYEKEYIDTNTTTQVKTGTGVLRRIVVGDIGSAETIQVYDDTDGTENQIVEIDGDTISTNDLSFHTRFSEGLRVVTSGTTAAKVTVIYE